jgi:hypothetical protein
MVYVRLLIEFEMDYGFEMDFRFWIYWAIVERVMISVPALNFV